MTSAKLRLWLVVSLLTVFVIAALVLLAAAARNTGAHLVINALERNSETIGTALRIQFERAINIGIALDQLVGVDSVLEDELALHQEVSFFALISGDQRLLSYVDRNQLNLKELREAKRLILTPNRNNLQSETFHIRTVELSGESGGLSNGTLLIGFPARYIDKQVNVVVIDLVVAALIAFILVTELLRYATRHSALHEFSRFREFIKHIKSRDFGFQGQFLAVDPTSVLSKRMDEQVHTLRSNYQELLARIEHAPLHMKKSMLDIGTQLQKIADRYKLNSTPQEIGNLGEASRLRMVVFLVALSDEICRPFFAVYASSLDGPIALSSEVLAGIPLTSFLLTWALSQPFGATLLRRFGTRNCLVSAATVTGLGMLATAITDTWLGLVVLRALTGFGFGCVLIFSQAIMLRIGRVTGRARAMAEFVAGVVAAGICGPAIGGLLAVKFGTTFTFVVSGCCALIAIVFAMGTKDTRAAEITAKSFSAKAVVETMRHPRLLLLMIFSAIPGKIASTAVLLMLVPLATAEMGESPSVAGRLLLLFFLGFFLVAGFAAKLSDQWNLRKPFIAAGGLLSALACLSGYAFDNIWGLFLTCSLLGLGQAWLSSPQIILVTQIMDASGTAADSELVLGFYRLVERFGGALGPVLAAVLIKQIGLGGAMLAFGLILAIGCLVTMLTLWSYKENATTYRETGAQAV